MVTNYIMFKYQIVTQILLIKGRYLLLKKVCFQYN